MFSRFFRKQAIPTIDPIAEAKLDVALNEPGQQLIAQSVKRLAVEDASMSWRSELNERLLSEQGRVQVRRRRVLVLRPAAGLAAASVFAWLLVSPSNVAPPPGAISSTLESNVMQAHLIAENNYRLTGAAVISRDTDTGALPQTAAYEWEEADLGAL